MPARFIPFALAPAVTLLALASPVASAARPEGCRVDRAQYAALREGMSYRRVRNALGCAGRKVGRIAIGRHRRTTYYWPAQGTYGANVTLTFRDGHLTDKTQLGLPRAGRARP